MGGTQRAMVNLAHGLVELGLEVELYASLKKEHFFHLDPRIQFSEAPKRVRHPVALTISLLTNIRKIAKKSEAQTIIVFDNFYNAVTLLATWGLKKRVFVSDRVSPFHHYAWYVKLFTRILFFMIKPAGIIAQTSDSAKYQRQRFGKKVPVEVIPNPVKEMKSYDCQRETIVLAVGRLQDPLKGFDRLIEAWGRINATGWRLETNGPKEIKRFQAGKMETEGWRLVFAGGLEADNPDLGKRAGELGVYETIDFLGKVQNMDELYAKASIFVMPSRSEGFPNALLEAMCAGLACISFDFVAGPKDIITDNVNGLLVANNDIEALAKSINELIHNPVLRTSLGNEAAKLSASYSLQAITKRLCDFMSC